MFIKFILVSFIYNSFIHLYNKKNINELSPIEIKWSENGETNYKQGYNEAYFTHPDDSKEKLIDIYINYEKYKLLKSLESNHISVYNKIKLIKKNYLILKQTTPNLLAGELLEDWNFEM